MRINLMWAIHNLIAHPASEVCWWLGYIIPSMRLVGDWLHDVTIPKHESGTGRG
jgi:hypothetical protein